MAGFLYFAKGWRQPVTLATAAEWGLGYAFEGEPVDAEFVHPDLGMGRLFCDLKRQNGRALKVRGAPEQVWAVHSQPREAPRRPALHVGYWADDAPRPEDLLRAEALPGHLVALGGGHSWEVPVALQWSDAMSQRIALPRGAVFDPERGEWSPGEVNPRYQRLWEIATAFDEFVWQGNTRAREAVEAAGETVEESDEIAMAMSVGEALSSAVEVLATNYRVGRVEASALGWFAEDHELSGQVLAALIDWPSLQAMLKKKAAPDTGGS